MAQRTADGILAGYKAEAMLTLGFELFLISGMGSRSQATERTSFRVDSNGMQFAHRNPVTLTEYY